MKRSRRSQQSQSMSESSSQSSQPRSTLVHNCVQTMLVLHQNKIPVKRADLNKHVFVNNDDRRLFQATMERVSDIFKNVYGFKVVEVPQQNQYILINKLRTKDPKIVQKSREENIEKGMLLTVLSIVFMSGGEVKESVLYNFFEKFGFHDHKSPIECLGIPLKALILQWKKQLYLKSEDTVLSERKETIFRWGFRAEKEMKKMDVLKFVSEIWGENATPDKWKRQYKEAKNEHSTLSLIQSS